MKRYLPVFAVLLFLSCAAYFLFNEKEQTTPLTQTDTKIKKRTLNLDEFEKQKMCARIPQFLYQNRIFAPIIDLSQTHYKGIAFIDAKTKKVLHKKLWERYDALGTYTIDKQGNLYLTPNPFISITPATFNLQKAIYKLSSNGKLSRWMVLDEIAPNARNPYGLISIVFDCDDNSLYVSAIDKSDYKSAKGRIYHINPQTKEILQKIEGFDALTLALLKTIKNKKYLLAGSARDNGVYANKIINNRLQEDFIKLFELPNPELRVRKIKVVAKNTLLLEAIKFNYSLIAQTAQKQRVAYKAIFDPRSQKWSIKKEH